MFRATSPRLLASSSGTRRTVLPRSARCRWSAGCSGSPTAASNGDFGFKDHWQAAGLPVSVRWPE
eukprot:15872579-Heterocapsa_arctica.AAC.1